ncbi:MAG: hypothetical protein KC475_07775, partial [Cyanobacteria bacterium HKST-UBA03]|nr:hypothetical protein [Cyanobacteria bacterium HKST-UBA03]
MSEPTPAIEVGNPEPASPLLWLNPTPPQLPVKMVAADARKTATGQIKGDHIELIVPSHWSNRFKVEATAPLINRLQKQFTKAWKTVSHHINEGACLVR